MQQESEFFDLDKADYGLVPVHCDVFAGFIFVNLDETPRQSLREFLGPMVTAIDGYPFEAMTERFSYRSRVNCNWKIFSDAFQEFYHAPVAARGAVGPGRAPLPRARRVSRRRTTRSTVRTACSAAPAIQPLEHAAGGVQADGARSTRSGLFGRVGRARASGSGCRPG